MKKYQLFLDESGQLKETNSNGSPRYEVEPWEMIQYDWKEDIVLTSRIGEKYTINILHMILKFSRYSYLEIALSKDPQTLFRAMINGFKFPIHYNRIFKLWGHKSVT